ncbi:AAA family ATPase [Lacticaseibacillus zeae]|uniref:UDP-N-acetylglucosamine kinase n=1 Tax=Lacticaseibacillus zeae subsp. silagei TaxID=3068307 RepID=A0ABD7ZAQ2_LACZE|nr:MULTISPECIES: AAA family ATPase [Lacticaseibacillus]MDE3314419.1 zeta toxin family protein [Lacticaseibacillus zeae]OFR98955.1 kinase [Lactobacillus sp. HMSC068F07]WLV84049.1 zeta toxin family protein [Lacticaseibacillus sp. NCIMB 15475]WLV86805.1 zeta toxin family protein [Lacticaseibacillus sp. NCIMB 15474]
MADNTQVLVLLAGAPGTGKTYAANKIMQAISGFVSLPLDLFKEHLYDELGFDNLQEKQTLDAEARTRYYRGIDILMNEHKMILGDYPFSRLQKPALKKLAMKNHYPVITIRLEADIKILYNRQRQRDLSDPRHLGHLMNHYHRGDTLESINEKPDGMPSFEVFSNRVSDRGYQNFQIGRLIRVDVNDYARVDYQTLVAQLNEFLKASDVGEIG